MSAFRSKGRRSYKVRVQHPDGRTVVCGCDTESRGVANAMRDWARSLRVGAHRRVDVLTAICDRRVSLPVAYDHRHDLDGLLATLNDVDLEPQLVAWELYKSTARKGAASAEKYRAQVETLITPGTSFLRSQFTARTIRRHLAELEVDDATRNRYRAAFSSFARFLVDHDVLERNVVRDIPGWPVSKPRETWYDMPDAERLVAALPQPFAAIEALMAGACLSWQDVSRLRAADVNLEANVIRAQGSKTVWRNRECRVLEIFEWCVPHIQRVLLGKHPSALLFQDVSERQALAQHRAAVQALGLVDSVLHDWRHTHLVLALKAGYPPIPLARQAGHKDANLLWTVYGKYVPQLDELTPRQATAALKVAR